MNGSVSPSRRCRFARVADQVRNPFFARVYASMMRNEDPKQVEHRREALGGLSGRVFELGAGVGSNFAHYPAEVTELVAAEPEPYLRERALAAAEAAPIDVQVVDAVADDLPFEDASFDAAVACLVLCTVPDQARALAELRRVIRPGGELRFYEHVARAPPAAASGARVRRPDATVAHGLRRLPRDA